MGVEDKDSAKDMDWKSIESASTDSGDGASVKKRLPKRMRQIPEYYFIPRRSLSFTMMFYGSCIAAGIGAGMLIEVWLNKKAEEERGANRRV
ncbi:Dihydrosphingosine phosphate lyase [Castilleja foliolosa]|uniref:Dihydrosphingosine phosphate lyase n=1 Tax=Castilleja foliolosa TaxID=1961234 RepID=A0ABD3BCX7_9LAMI